MTNTRLLSRLICGILLGAVGLMFFAAPARAHLGIEESTPGNAEELRRAPTEAVLTFTAEVDLTSARAQLRILGGVDTPLSEATNREVETIKLTYVRGEGRTAVFDLPELENGMYALDWSINEAGGHSSTSFILFKVVDSDGIGSWPYLALTVGLIAIGAARLYSYGRKR